MANKYCNLLGSAKIKDEYTKINTGFDGVDADNAAAKDRMNKHVSSASEKHSAQNITYAGEVPASENVKEALDHIQTQVSAIVTGDANAEVGAAHVSESKGKVFDTIGDRFEEIEESISSGVTNTHTLGFGMNTIKYTGIGAPFPTIDFTGRHIVSILQKGNFPDTSQLATSDSTIAVASNILTITGTGTGAYPQAIQFTTTPPGKRYYKRVYARITTAYTGNAYIAFQLCGATSGISGQQIANPVVNQWYCLDAIADTTSFVGNLRTVIYHQYDSAAIASSKKLEVKEEILLEIGADSSNPFYGKTSAEMLAFFPNWIDSGVMSLKNLYFENRRKNLVRNGNGEDGIGYWVANTSTVALNIENLKFKIVSTSGGGSFEQIVILKANTNYHISGNLSGLADSVIRVVDYAGNVVLKTGIGSFNTSANTLVKIRVTAFSVGTTYFDSIMLIEGTMAPTTYESCEHKAFTISKTDGSGFMDGDHPFIKNGVPDGQVWWKRKVLYGKDNNWLFGADMIGYKKFTLSTSNFQGLTSSVTTSLLTKYDGKVLPFNSSTDAADSFAIFAGSSMYFQIADTDTGFAEGINPNDDEAKLIFNGWKAIGSNGNGRYIGWKSVVDDSLPSATRTTTITSVISTTIFNVTDASIFAVNDYIGLWDTNNAWWIPQITNIVGLQITVATPISPAIKNGSTVFKADNGTTNTNLLTWCKNNVAPNFPGYTIDYKLANPEPITDLNMTLKGDVWALEQGDNYITIDSGIVLGEVANPQLQFGYYKIDSLYQGSWGLTQYKNERIIAVYKNGIPDTLWEIQTDINAYGRQTAAILQANYDPNATYTVDYQILKTLHAQVANTLTLTYGQDLISSVESHAEALEGKQPRSSALDNVNALGISEDCELPSNSVCPWIIKYGVLYVDIRFSFKTVKQTKPRISIKNIDIHIGDNNATADFSLQDVLISKNEVILRYKTTVAQRLTDARNGGALAICKITAECGGVI